MIVYADVLFLINFISAYALLYLLGKFIVKTRLKKLRLYIAAALEAVCAVVVFTLPATQILSFFLRAISAFFMVFIAFYDQKRQVLTHIIWLITLSALVIAAMILIAGVSGITVGAVIKAGVIYFDLPEKIFVPMFILSYGVIVILMRVVKKRRLKRIYMIAITYCGKTVKVTALFDSGNLLKEPLTGKSVCLVERNKISDFFIEKNLSDIRIYAVPYHTVGTQNGIIYAFKPDRLEILGDNRIIENVLIGLYDGQLSKNAEYAALLGAEMI